MTRFTYYSPLVLGLVAAAAAFAMGYEGIPQGRRALYITLGCVGAALLCQAAMLGFQGLWANVLPAPGGRSIRGRAATLCGGLILGAIACAAAAFLLAYEQAESAQPLIEVAGRPGQKGWTVSRWLLVVAGVLGVTAVGAYIWAVPAAVRDFETQRLTD